MDNLKNRFIGNVSKGKVVPFNAHNGITYVFDGNNLPNPSYYYSDGRMDLNTGWSKASVILNVNKKYWDFMSAADFIKYFPNHPDSIAAVAAQTKPAKLMARPTFVVSKGKLYFNVTTKQVERVLTVQDGSLIWTSRHKQEAKPYGKSTFRLATQTEVDNYLAEASANAN